MKGSKHGRHYLKVKGKANFSRDSLSVADHVNPTVLHPGL